MRRIHANRTSRIYFTCTFALWVLVNVIYVAWEAKPPFLDVFLFKEAGVNLATEGRFVAANLPHMPPETSLAYAYYAPLYPFTYGLWTSVLGVGLKQSILFDHLIKGARSLIIFLFLAPWLIPRLNYHSSKAIAVLLSLLTLSFLPYYNDRPDELALVFGLMSWLFISGPEPFGKHFTWSGVFLGLCAATSPVAAMLFGMGSICYFLSNHSPWRTIVPKAIAVVAVFSLCMLPLVLLDGTAWSRFFADLPLSFFPTNTCALGKSWIQRAGFAFLPLTMFLAMTLLFLRRVRGVSGRIWQPYLVASALYAVISTFVWSAQPRYLWFPCITSFLVMAALWLDDSSDVSWLSRRNSLVFAGLAIALIPGICFEARFLAEAMERPDGESGRAIREKVLSYLEPSARLAVPPDQFFTFRSAKEISMTSYVCPWLDQYDYVYMTPHDDSKEASLPVISHCEEQKHCFTAFKDFRDPRTLTVLGYETSHMVYGNGGILFKNTNCRGSWHAQNP